MGMKSCEDDFCVSCIQKGKPTIGFFFFFIIIFENNILPFVGTFSACCGPTAIIHNKIQEWNGTVFHCCSIWDINKWGNKIFLNPTHSSERWWKEKNADDLVIRITLYHVKFFICSFFYCMILIAISMTAHYRKKKLYFLWDFISFFFFFHFSSVFFSRHHVGWLELHIDERKRNYQVIPYSIVITIDAETL